MKSISAVAVVSSFAACLVAAPVRGADITGQYLEVRTCDVYTAACFANAEIDTAGKHAILGWKVERGSLDGIRLDGLSVVAVVAASDTLGTRQNGPAKSVLLVDDRADSRQREALVRLARRQAGSLLDDVRSVEPVRIELSSCECDGGRCARLVAGKVARIETRCFDAKHDTACGNEGAFYPPLSQGVKAVAAVAVEQQFSGKAFGDTWKEFDRRGAYVGTFAIR